MGEVLICELTAPASVTIGEPFEVTLTVKNWTAREARFGRRGDSPWIGAARTDEGGLGRLVTGYGRSVEPFVVKPGLTRAVVAELVLNGQPGDYVVFSFAKLEDFKQYAVVQTTAKVAAKGALP
jgi:hypothetical protein